eukprot:NODE_64_length_26047_cov_1.706837.p9 type:complete len:287 gc:universal NODE_64_length_26047_cov_1.706837:8923-8063(-)
MKFFYAVVRGHNPGLYKHYDDVKKQTSGFSNAFIKKFHSQDEAIQYLRQKLPDFDTRVPVATLNADSAKLAKKNKRKYYGVRVGHSTGVFENWEDVEPLVKGFPCAQFKSFKSKQDAIDYVGSIPIHAVSNDSIEIYTDGSCLDNVGGNFIGYACYFGKDDKRNYIGGELKGTNNIAEIKAIIFALRILQNKDNCTIYTDSNYVIQGISNWKKLIENGEFEELPQDLKNRDHWIELLKLLHRHDGQFIVTKIKAHVGHYGNEKADQMAKMGANYARMGQKDFPLPF